MCNHLNGPSWQPSPHTKRITILPRFALATSSVAALLILLSPNAGATTLAGWSQYGRHGAVEARLVTNDPACPALMADGGSLPMTERAAPSKAFPVRVCVAT